MVEKILNLQKKRESIGDMLRFWRRSKRVSQMDLALDVGISSKHLSFVETGKSHPSRGLVLKLVQALKLPLRHRNAFLTAAGYAAEFTEEPFDGQNMALIRQALRRMLDQHEPFPAFVVNTGYRILMTNSGYDRFITLFLGENALNEHHNLIHMLYAPNGLKQFIRDWPSVEAFLIARLQDEVISTQNSELIDVYETVSAMRDTLEPLDIPIDTRLPILSMTVEKEKISASFFTMMTTLGTPLDLTAQELRIESLFPADDKTIELFEV